MAICAILPMKSRNIQLLYLDCLLGPKKVKIKFIFSSVILYLTFYIKNAFWKVSINGILIKMFKSIFVLVTILYKNFRMDRFYIPLVIKTHIFVEHLDFSYTYDAAQKL